MVAPKIAILSTDRPYWEYPCTESLSKQLTEIGVEHKVFYNGLESIRSEGKEFDEICHELSGFNLFVILGHIPESHFNDFFREKELREAFPETPIIIHDLLVCPTHHSLWRALELGSGDKMWTQVDPRLKEGGHCSYMRYEWTLAINAVGGMSIPRNTPYTQIGISLEDTPLNLNKKHLALIDVDRGERWQKYRETNIKCCEDFSIPYKLLEDGTSSENMKKIYQETTIFFPGFPKSFGLIFNELQAAGSIIVVPNKGWCIGQWIKDNVRLEGPGYLNDNFVVYRENLYKAIGKALTDYNPSKAVEEYKTKQPHLYYGDKDELKKFIGLYESGFLNKKLSYKIKR